MNNNNKMPQTSCPNYTYLFILLPLLFSSLHTTESRPPFACDPNNALTRTLPFCQVALHIRDRVHDLIGRLTLQEKIRLLVNNAAGVPRLGLSGYEWWSEALHGVANTGPGTKFGGAFPGATSFPQVILSAASFNASLWVEIGRQTYSILSFQKCVCLYHRKNRMMEDCTVNRRPSQSSPLPKRRVIVESSVSSSESNNHRKKRKMTKLWSETNTDHFLDILLECKRGAGPMYNGKGVTSILVTHVLHELSKRTNTTYNVGQVREKHKRMKTDWGAFRKLIETTGAGWNAADNTIDVPKDKWEDVNKCEHSAKFLKKGLKRCEDMNELWLGVEATGAFARSCNDAPLSSDGEQELLRREFHQEEGSSQTCEQRGKSSRKGKKHMRDDSTMSYSPYSRSQSGKNNSNSAMSGANSVNHSSESLISMKALAYKAIVDKFQSKAAETVWSLGRCLDEVNGMEELKDRDGNIPHALLFKATDLFDAIKHREAFMHYPHRTRVWFIQTNCPLDDDVPVAK